MTVDSIDSLQDRLQRFAEERDWDQFHSAQNLSVALSVEASELLEIFQWMNEEEAKHLSDRKLAQAGEELADVFVYTARLADKLGVDLWEAVTQKIEKNESKYPAATVYGSAKKYTEY
ncbi:nucleotide pyrophosphohydrolase [Tamilnaduibacter salinus]|uniref:Nucleotide pyrophosphohydrolase n=1 Tax=Tamilnaduibacter salinus TaxID=1484056 RepID=A0A2A2HZJ7_9GAMM|nr:nucleotide pyrophosphohydrolase [Tamilnaduibacter salinus]PAV24456.1 nucleotide pyrophosphohydrolase [Tamilnaduibacter salinus]